MDNPTAKLLRSRAYQYAWWVTRSRQDADELAQDVIVRYLEYQLRHGKVSRQTVDQAVIDCLRARVSRYGPRHRIDPRPFDEIFHGSPPQETPVRELDLTVLDNPDQRLVISMTLDNIPNRVIAEALGGVTESRVSQIRNNAVIIMRQTLP